MPLTERQAVILGTIRGTRNCTATDLARKLRQQYADFPLTRAGGPRNWDPRGIGQTLRRLPLLVTRDEKGRYALTRKGRDKLRHAGI